MIARARTHRLRRAPPSSVPPPQGEARPSDERVDEARRPWLACAACGHRLAPTSGCFAMPGHGAMATFVNPGGYVHEVLTVRRAPGALAAGDPVRADSWFPGTTWRFALCGGCTDFVGWFYEPVGADGPEPFWGLRAAAVRRD